MANRVYAAVKRMQAVRPDPMLDRPRPYPERNELTPADIPAPTSCQSGDLGIDTVNMHVYPL